MYVLKSAQGDYVSRIDRIGAAFGGGYSILLLELPFPGPARLLEGNRRQGRQSNRP